MCRFISYIGKPLLLDDVLYKPNNSLIHQSTHALEMEEPLNGDGFGLGWYAHEIDNIPGVFKSIRPAWNDMNLKYLSQKIRSNCLLAHIRAASQGGVTATNCHPFHYKQYLFMHNGTIHGFEKLIRPIRRQLSDEIYHWVKGHTDSEHFFAMFIDKLNKEHRHFNAAVAAELLKQTLKELLGMREKLNINETAFLNVVITNGKSLVAMRYVSNPEEEARTLYYAHGQEYSYHDGKCHMLPTEQENEAVLIVSEKLTDFSAEWHLVPTNHMVLVYEDLDVEIKEIKF